jgi:uncharacterized protein YwgA
MSTSCDKVISTLRSVNLQFDIHSYISKLFVQKTVFLAQTLGVSTAYPFNYYIHGPYSPNLTADYYNNTEKFTTLESNYELTVDEKIAIQKIKDCNLYESPSVMESTASVVFLATHRILELRDHEMFAKLKSEKPFLTDENVLDGITKAKILLFKPEYFTDELKKELSSWNQLSCSQRER